MVSYRGYKTVVVYDEETGYGTGSTPATVIKGRIQSVTVNQSNELIREVGAGEGRNETFVAFGNYTASWSMEYNIGDFAFLQFGIGSKNGSGTTAAPYYLQEEEFMDYTAGADSGMKSFGFIVNGLDVSGGTHNKDLVEGAVMNNIGLSLELGASLKCTIDGFARKVTSSTVTTSFSPDTTKPWIFSQGAFKWNGSAVARVQSATINIANNFDESVGRELGSRFVEAAEPGLRKYDWTITVKMTDTVATTLRDDFYGQANSPNLGVDDAEPTFYALILALAEGSASGDRIANILLSDCAINDISKPVNVGENIVELTINGTAKKGTTDTTNRVIKWYTVT